MYRLDGLMIVHVIIDDNSDDNVVSDPGFVADWAAGYGIEFPVVLETAQTAFAGAASSALYEGGIPFRMLLDPELRVVAGYTGSGVDAAIEADIKDVLDLW